MIEIGTRVQWTDRSGTGTVTQIKRRTFVVAWDDQAATTVWEYEYYHLVDSNGDGFYIEIIPSAPVVMHDVSGNNAERASFYAGAVGVMEYRLRDLYGSIAGAREALTKQNIAGAQWYLAWAADRIESTSVRLAEKPVPNGATSLTYLRDAIYQDRK